MPILDNDQFSQPRKIFLIYDNTMHVYSVYSIMVTHQFHVFMTIVDICCIIKRSVLCAYCYRSTCWTRVMLTVLRVCHRTVTNSTSVCRRRVSTGSVSETGDSFYSLSIVRHIKFCFDPKTKSLKLNINKFDLSSMAQNDSVLFPIPSHGRKK